MILQCHDLEFGYSLPLGCLDYRFEGGAVIALVGDNGSGKSTLIQTIAGELPAISGNVEVRDSSGKLADNRFSVTRIAEPVFYPELTIREHFLLIRKYAPLREGRYSIDWEIDGLMEKFPGTLSSGQRQRCYLAIQLESCKNFLVLDEPERHLDLRWQERLKVQIERLREYGFGIIVASHSLALVDLADGKIFLSELER